MTAFIDTLTHLATQSYPTAPDLLAAIASAAKQAGYHVAETDDARPWGGFIRFEYADGDMFVDEFFTGTDPVVARLGNPQAELSPKILLVAPKQRLSWQVHARRAERWKFITAGGYHKSMDADVQGDVIMAQAGDDVQFAAGECHRLVGDAQGYTIVAEIWQHTDPTHLSDEADITRLADDYRR